jgi:hypothetical protein
MGASDSKLVFKKGIFKLSEERSIPADDPYWTSVSYSSKRKVTSANDLSFGSSLNPQRTSSASSRPQIFGEQETPLLKTSKHSY